MISINNVRNTVLFFLNKNNRGYITPLEFDAFCKMAQLEIFEQLFYDLNAFLNKKQKRLTNTEYANLPKNIRQQIDNFATYTTSTNFTLDDGAWVYSGTDKIYRYIGMSVVYPNGKKIDCEELMKSVWNNVVNSDLNKPSLIFPVFRKINDTFEVNPILPTNYRAELFFLRTPKDPKWTFITTVNGDPIYNASATDKQDIELDESLFSKLVIKVLAYSGLSIREEQVMSAANQEEIKNFNTKQ
jgi:hypothetical protein